MSTAQIRAAAFRECAELLRTTGEERLAEAYAPLVSGHALMDRTVGAVSNAHGEAGWTLIRMADAIDTLADKERDDAQ